MKILAVTACPFGIAHTYMAAEMIQLACEKEGVECKVETQGSLGVENVITAEEVAEADIAVLTTDMPIKDIERFDNIEKVMVGISDIVKNAEMIIQKLISDK